MSWLSWAMLAALFAGLTGIFSKVGVTQMDVNLANAIRTSVILVFAWLIVLVIGKPVSAISPRNWLFLVLSALATGASWMCYLRALQMGDASQVAPIDKLSVLVVMVLGAVFLGESLTWTHWLGGLFITLGAVLIALPR